MASQPMLLPQHVAEALHTIKNIEQQHSIASLQQCYNQYRSLLQYQTNNITYDDNQQHIADNLQTLKPLFLCYRSYLHAKKTVTKYKLANPNMLRNYDPNYQQCHIYNQSLYCQPTQQNCLSTTSNDHANYDTDIYNQCANCQRCQPKYLVDTYGIDSCFVLQFTTHPSSVIKERRKF